ncbi:hypothetical protein AB205_0113940 [Aquarana catesbeiana]|uniref:G-protein coupled receptors family 1 profile domain-containing protein n=1 Tax=Aquarana catesbeiana TaxID=8400 RepID=A0A2G9RCV3_AQUCT|nr:hypothetical protein AB205_0113940 [Aquarana catesbeiana]
MRNVTEIMSFTLVGLSDHPLTMNGLFVLFLLIYLMTLITNLLIFFLVLTDYNLHNPMYFFLANLAFLDMLSFCRTSSIHNFFCDLPSLYQITCTDPFINMVVVFLVSAVLGIGDFLLTFLPYAYIFRTILRIRSKTGKMKAFSTCSSHITVVVIFYGCFIFIYLVPTSSDMFNLNKLFSIVSSLINPLLNPLIYSLRNKDLMEALMRSYYHLKLIWASF